MFFFLLFKCASIVKTDMFFSDINIQKQKKLPTFFSLSLYINYEFNIAIFLFLFNVFNNLNVKKTTTNNVKIIIFVVVVVAV